VCSIVVALAALAPAQLVAAGIDDPPPPPATVNDFIPEDRDLSECISSLPKPGCGSDARGGWRQGVVLALVLGGMLAIGVRVAVAVRRRDRALTAEAETPADPRVPNP
jgi:hypothetical protein